MPYADKAPEAFNDDLEDDQALLERKHVTSWSPVVHNRRLMISGALLVTTFLLLLTYGTLQVSHQEFYDCGSSPEEARAKDCQFDMLGFAWVPKQCYDAELANSWDTYHEFEFYYDNEHTRRISVEELKKGINHYIFTTGRYHRSHCVYAWQTLQRAVKGGYHLSDNKTLSLNHYDHCSFYLININDTFQARFQMDYLYCDRLWSGPKSLLW